MLILNLILFLPPLIYGQNNAVVTQQNGGNLAVAGSGVLGGSGSSTGLKSSTPLPPGHLTTTPFFKPLAAKGDNGNGEADENNDEGRITNTEADENQDEGRPYYQVINQKLDEKDGKNIQSVTTEKPTTQTSSTQHPSSNQIGSNDAKIDSASASIQQVSVSIYSSPALFLVDDSLNSFARRSNLTEIAISAGKQETLGQSVGKIVAKLNTIYGEHFSAEQLIDRYRTHTVKQSVRTQLVWFNEAAILGIFTKYISVELEYDEAKVQIVAAHNKPIPSTDIEYFLQRPSIILNHVKDRTVNEDKPKLERFKVTDDGNSIIQCSIVLPQLRKKRSDGSKSLAPKCPPGSKVVSELKRKAGVPLSVANELDSPVHKVGFFGDDLGGGDSSLSEFDAKKSDKGPLKYCASREAISHSKAAFVGEKPLAVERQKPEESVNNESLADDIEPERSEDDDVVEKLDEFFEEANEAKKVYTDEAIKLAKQGLRQNAGKIIAQKIQKNGKSRISKHSFFKKADLPSEFVLPPDDLKIIDATDLKLDEYSTPSQYSLYDPNGHIPCKNLLIET